MDENLRLIRTKSVEKVCVPPRASEPLWFLRQPFQDSSTSSRPRPSEWRLVADYPSSNTLARCWLAPATTRNANRSASCFLPGYYSREQITPPWRGGVTQVRPIVASIGLFCSTASPMMTSINSAHSSHQKEVNNVISVTAVNLQLPIRTSALNNKNTF